MAITEIIKHIYVAYNLMNSLIEYFIFTEDQKNDQGHVNVVRVAVRCMVQSLQYWNNLRVINTNIKVLPAV